MVFQCILYFREDLRVVFNLSLLKIVNIKSPYIFEHHSSDFLISFSNQDTVDQRSRASSFRVIPQPNNPYSKALIVILDDRVCGKSFI